VTPPEPTGINYARIVDAARQAELAQGVNYAALTGTTPAEDTDSIASTGNTP
jgi:hypothetical protein